MSKKEILTLKDEFLKEIHDLENKLNQQILTKFKKIEETNSKFIVDFDLLFQKNKTLLDSISSKNLNLEKINDFENFRKKTDDMMITHEIRINNNIKDIQNIIFKYDKQISDNLTVPGYVGINCKYKTISNYISSNINEISKMKIESETFKKENKELRKKVDDIIKTVLNLVNNSSTKLIQYVDNKTNNIKDLMNKKFEEFSDKVIDFKSLIISQEKNKEIINLVNNFQKNNYQKEEIDKKLNEILNTFYTVFEEFKKRCLYDFNLLIRTSDDKFEEEINEINQNIKEIKNKIHNNEQIQNEIIEKNNLLIKSLKANISEKNIRININNFSSNNKSTYLKRNSSKLLNEEEIKFRNFGFKEKSKTIESLEDLKNKNNIQSHIIEPKKSIEIKEIKEIEEIKEDKENKDNNDNNKDNDNLIKLKKTNINNNQNNIKQDKSSIHSRNSKKNLLFISKSQNNKEKSRNSYFNNIRSEEKKNTISVNRNENELYLSMNHNNSNKSYNKINNIEKDDKNNYTTPYNNKSKTISLNKTENKNRKHLYLLRKVNIHKSNKLVNEKISNLKSINNNNSIKENLSNFLSYGMNNQKGIITSIENENSNNKNLNNNPIVQLIEDDLSIKDIIDNKNNGALYNMNINKINKKKEQFSLHQLANLGLEVKSSKVLPIMNSFSETNLLNKNKKINTPLIKNVFHQTFQMNQNISSEIPVKIQAAFGRTGYIYYDKKEEGINNLINIGIKNKMKKANTISNDINFGLSPTAKIKVYNNM